MSENHFSRRRLLTGSPALAAAVTTAFAEPTHGIEKTLHRNRAEPAKEFDLCTEWQFRTDPEAAGDQRGWQKGGSAIPGCIPVTLPHTWQVKESFTDYRGDAWYTKTFTAPQSWAHSVVRIEFEAVYHSAMVWINGHLAGEHPLKGYTAFAFDITRLLYFDQSNTISVRVNNAFNEHMLPRARSSDWALDGGIYRPVRLLVTNRLYAEHVEVDALPKWQTGSADLRITAYLNSGFDGPTSGSITMRVVDEHTGDIVLSDAEPSSFHVQPGTRLKLSLERAMKHAMPWHFDNPHLYRLEVIVESSDGSALLTTTFGVRQLEIRDGAFFFNNEKVILAGVERMAGSNPEFGMAEPAEWIEHDHRDLKQLNCVFTRVHWPQDKRVLDYCDRQGILMQEEVPTWGAATFTGMSEQPDPDIMQNGLEQLGEMVGRDRNHPCIVSWGLCNEINGQNPPAYHFAKNMLAAAKKLDPYRLCAYASNSLFHTQSKDVSGLMDFVECNEYYGSWEPGGPSDLSRTLDEIHAAFPDKPVVISEYGYCACTPDRLEGDGHRSATLSAQNAVLRSKPFIAGAIFFCYNDYRTHIGDRGVGVMKQRIHGIVDLYGVRKPSYQLLRSESSPIESLTFENFPDQLLLTVKTRDLLPSYVARGYTVRAVFYESENIPLNRIEQRLPDLAPGATAQLRFAFEATQPLRIAFEVLRPTGFSAATLEWLR